jgi:hypothetical protein
MTDPTRSDKNGGIGVLGKLFIALAVVAAALVTAKSFDYFVETKFRDGISVAGSARRRITSDRAIWAATVHARGATLVEAYQTLQQGVPRVRQFLLEKGIREEDLEIGSVQSEELHTRTEDGIEIPEQIVGYSLWQSVTVTSEDLDLVGRVSQDITQLIEGGVDVTSNSPEYIYSELGDVKVQLVGEATADARERAEEVARNSGGALGRLVSARVGVVQVNAANQTEVSWDGVYDRSSVEKDVTVVVSTMFLLE